MVDSNDKELEWLTLTRKNYKKHLKALKPTSEKNSAEKPKWIAPNDEKALLLTTIRTITTLLKK
ncbi:22716_t:CDS:2, partial [Gigaspora rosea]